MGWPSSCFYTVVYSSSGNTGHHPPSAPGFLNIRLFWFCCRHVGPGIWDTHSSATSTVYTPHAPEISDYFHKPPCPFRCPCLCAFANPSAWTVLPKFSSWQPLTLVSEFTFHVPSLGELSSCCVPPCWLPTPLCLLVHCAWIRSALYCKDMFPLCISS